MSAQGELKSTPLSLGEFAQVSGVLAGVIVFIYLIGADTLKALKKRAFWIPGDALVVSALTIQVLNLLDGHSNILKELLDGQPLNGEDVKNNLFMIHTSRVMLCVLLAYLLPGMARPGSEDDSWNQLAALGLSIFLHISSELFSVNKRLSESGLYLVSSYFYFWPHAKKVTRGSFIVSGVIISLSLIWLIALLSSAIIANKGIRDIIRQKIPKILARQSNDTENSWPAVEQQVFRSWIVARACYPEYIIARSVLATSAALAVTICIISSIIGWLVQGPIVILFDSAASWLKFITTYLEVVFILIGWAIISWRWLTSVAYYGRWERQKKVTWPLYGSFSLGVEDFWTRNILELQEAAHEKSQKLELGKRVSKILIATEGKKIRLPGILLRCVFWLQICVVLFSKGCWFLSNLVFRLSPMLFSKHFREMEKESLNYKEILEDVPILRETTVSVFVANRTSIKQAEELERDGYRDGKECATLIRFLSKYYRSPRCVDIRCLDLGTGFKFLCKLKPGPDLGVEKHFIFASKPSWKLAAVSLINIIVRLSPECGRDSVKAYREAWELIDLVDESDPETDSLLSKAADMSLFKTLQQPIAENTPAKSSDPAITTIEEAAATINNLAEESKSKANVIGDGQDSLDWKKAAAGNALYKLCKSIDCGSGDFEELKNELQSALAGVIGACILKVKAALMDNCIQWAQDLQERKLLTAIYTAGKCKGLVEKLDWVDISATTREPTMASQA